MEALYTGEEFADADAPESVANILARYADIEELFPEELGGAALPYFVDWLIENVHLVEITAYSDDDAYTIFETMNDRGLSLTPADMLKGYLLANITDAEQRTRASRVWKERVQALAELGKDEDADGIKSWLRSQYAESIRERKRGAAPQDFDLIGTEFHRWVRDHEERLGLTASAEFARFIERDFAFYSRWYERLRARGRDAHAGPRVRPLQRPAQLHAPVPGAARAAAGRRRRGDGSAQAPRRGRLSRHPDPPPHLELARHRLLDDAVRDVPRDARHPRQERAGAGGDCCASASTPRRETFASNDRFRLHGMNGRQIHRLLARMTDYVETRSGQASRYAEYAQRGRKGYEIEHIWADHPERHTDEFAHPSEFAGVPQSHRRPAAPAQELQRELRRPAVRREARALPRPEPARAEPPRAGLRPQPGLPALHRGERPAVSRARGVQEGRPRRTTGALPATR